MKLIGPTTVAVTIDPHKFLHAPQDRKNLHYLWERFCSGDETAVKEFESWGITIQMPAEEWIKQPSAGYAPSRRILKQP